MNSQLEMAAVFDRAGFKPADVHMTDLIAGRVQLERFKGLVACGGFSYGDVLGAGEGWAKSILFNASLREQFAAFFARPDSFSLGVCNGCQMMSTLQAADSGRRALAALRPQSLGAVRGPGGTGRDPADAVGVLRGHGRLGAADRGGARRGQGGICR